jgi:hypothetical protein
MLVAEIARQHEAKRPKVPVVWIGNKGRSEENPNDPDFIDALRAWETSGVLSLYDAYLLAGTRIVSVPAGMATMDDPTWLDQMGALGQDVSTPERRRLAWLRFVAVRDPDNIATLAKEVGNRTFVREDEVDAAAEAFPGDNRG